MAERMIGKVKWFNERKGFGFIECDDLEDDVFVHYSNIAGGDKYLTLAEQQRVEFDLVRGGKGLAAHDVLKI